MISTLACQHGGTALIFLLRFDFTLPSLCVPVPAAIIASMSLSCGAGHADDVSERWRGRRFSDEDSRDQLGGVIYWLWRALSLS